MSRALNETLPASRESSSSILLAIDELLAELNGSPSMPKTVGPPDFRDREFIVERVGARSTRDAVEVFEVHWAKTEVPRRFISRSQEGAIVVRCDGEECEVHSHARKQEAPNEIRVVEWKPSWLTREQLEQLGHAMEPGAGNEEEQQPETQSHGDGRQAGGQGEDPSGPNTGQADTTTGTDPSRPRQAVVDEVKFQPMARLAYTESILKILAKGASKKLDILLKMPAKRELVFRNRFVDKGSFYNALERKCRFGAALQIVGKAKKRKCDHCRRGNGPFEECVILPWFAKSACANCVYGSVGTRCNYHVESQASGGPWTPRKAASSSRPNTAEVEAASPEAPRTRSRATTANGRRNDARRSAVDEEQPEDPASRPQSPAGTAANPHNSVQQGASKQGKLRRTRKRPLIDEDPQQSDGQAGAAQAPSSRRRSTHRNSSQQLNGNAQTGAQSGTAHDNASPKTPDWHVNYLAPGFRHEGCPPAPSPCVHFIAGFTDLSSALQSVRRGHIFKRGEASPEQVRWLIHRSDCSTTELMSRAWLHRLAQRTDSPLPKGCTKETFLSQWHPGKLSQAAALFGVG